MLTKIEFVFLSVLDHRLNISSKIWSFSLDRAQNLQWGLIVRFSLSCAVDRVLVLIVILLWGMIVNLFDTSLSFTHMISRLLF